DRYSMADRRDRIQHGALGVRQRPWIGHCERRGDRTATADETHTVGLERDLRGIGSMHAHQMKHPRRLLFDGACTTRAENRLSFPDDLGLHDKIAERRMEGVRGW